MLERHSGLIGLVGVRTDGGDHVGSGGRDFRLAAAVNQGAFAREAGQHAGDDGAVVSCGEGSMSSNSNGSLGTCGFADATTVVAGSEVRQ